MQISCNIINMLDEGAGNCFGCKFSRSGQDGQVTMFMPCNRKPPSCFVFFATWNTMAATPSLLKLNNQAHVKILQRPSPLPASPLLSSCLRVFEKLSSVCTKHVSWYTMKEEVRGYLQNDKA